MALPALAVTFGRYAGKYGPLVLAYVAPTLATRVEAQVVKLADAVGDASAIAVRGLGDGAAATLRGGGKLAEAICERAASWIKPKSPEGSRGVESLNDGPEISDGAPEPPPVRAATPPPRAFPVPPS